jgi:hypothetical protein
MKNAPATLCVVATALLLVSITMAGLPVTTAQGVGVTITISPLDPQSIHVVVSATEPGTASFNATVTVTKPPTTSVTVNMDGETTAGWPVTVQPETLYFPISDSKNVTATVVIPQGTPALEQEQIGVFAIATYPGGSQTADSHAVINIEQYFRGEVESAPAETTASELDVNLTVWNKGNGLDEFTLEIENLSKELEAGFDFDFSTTQTKQLEIQEFEVITLTVTYSGDERPKDHTFSVRVISDYAKSSGTKPDTWEYQVNVTFKKKTSNGGNGNGNGNNGGGISLDQNTVLLLVVFMILVVIVIVAMVSSKKKKKKRSRRRRRADEEE